MNEYLCQGLHASRLNAWLAVVGATVVDPSLRLRWSADATPRAILGAERGDPVDRLVAAWPTAKDLENLPLARDWQGAPALERKVSVQNFRGRARAARSHPASWTLSSTMTDLDVNKSNNLPGGEVSHAPLDPAGPGTIKWLHHRLLKVHKKIVDVPVAVKSSLDGVATHVKDNGLGFDVARLGSQGDHASKWVDPVVETLAFYGLALLPMRGAGTDRHAGGTQRSTARQRGWVAGLGRHQGRLRLHWPAWRLPLDCWGIDALLDAWNHERRASWTRVGVTAGWRTVQYKQRGSSDSTRAFGSERL